MEMYVRRHEKGSTYRDSLGQPIFLINKHLVFLTAGAGFGELALMSDMKRMATVRTSCKTSFLCTLTKKNFANVMRRA